MGAAGRNGSLVEGGVRKRRTERRDADPVVEAGRVGGVGGSGGVVPAEGVLGIGGTDPAKRE